MDYYGLNVISRYDDGFLGFFRLACPNRELTVFGVNGQVRLFQTCQRG